MAVANYVLADLVVYTGIIAGLNLVVGKVRIWSIGHIGFYALGELAIGYGTTEDIPLSVSLGGAITISLVVATVLGLVTFRLHADFFVVLSIAFVVLVYGIGTSLFGPQGVSGIERLASLGGDSSTAYLFATVFPVTLATLVFTLGFGRSPLERVSGLMRTSEAAAGIFGVPVRRVQLAVFSVGSVSTTLLGALAATFFGNTEPGLANLYRGILVFSMMLLGGIDTIGGTILGAAILTLVPRLLELAFQGPYTSYYAAQFSLIVFGVLMLVTLRFMPSGILGRRRWKD